MVRKLICKVFGHKWLRGKEGIITTLIDVLTAGASKGSWTLVRCKRCYITFDEYKSSVEKPDESI
jgi:hypothetical protein